MLTFISLSHRYRSVVLTAFLIISYCYIHTESQISCISLWCLISLRVILQKGSKLSGSFLRRRHTMPCARTQVPEGCVAPAPGTPGWARRQPLEEFSWWFSCGGHDTGTTPVGVAGGSRGDDDHFVLCRGGSGPRAGMPWGWGVKRSLLRWGVRSRYRNAESPGVPKTTRALILRSSSCGSQAPTPRGQESFQGFVCVGNLPAALASVRWKVGQENIQDSKSRPAPWYRAKN